MKYILWPPFAVLLFTWALIFGVLKIVWSLVWNFRLMGVREAYTNKDGEFLFGDWSWKEFFTFLLVCPYPEKKDDENEDFMEDEYED